jgi:hypothetical protein
MKYPFFNFYLRRMLREEEREVRMFCYEGLIGEIEKRLAGPRTVVPEDMFEENVSEITVVEEEVPEPTIVEENDIITVERPSITTASPEPPKKVTFNEEVETKIITEEIPAWEEPKEEIITKSSQEATLTTNRVTLENNIPPFKPVNFLSYRGRDLPCKCNKRWLKQKADEHFKWTTVTTKMNLHCCKCGRPTNRNNINDGGNWGYYQLCNSCFKHEDYDITKESWYNKPCLVCDKPMLEKVNIAWGTDVCSEVCKYAYLVVKLANCYEHIPQKVTHYIQVKNCTEDEEEVREAAKDYWIKLNGIPDEGAEYRRYYNNETWSEARQRTQEEYDELRGTMEMFLQNNYNQLDEEDQAHIEEINRAIAANEEVNLERIPKILDLKRYKKHCTQKINFCHGCLYVYDDEDLMAVGKQLLCKYIKERNEDPCYKEEILEEDKENISPNDVQEYLDRRNMEYQKKFILCLAKNKEKTNNAWQPYKCERCTKLITRNLVKQVLNNVSCEACCSEWALQLYEKEKVEGTFDEKKHFKRQGAGHVLRRREKRASIKGKEKAQDDSSGDDES